jgi:hypothetical protein
MKLHIDRTEFGSITIAGERLEHDVVLRLDGSVEKRKKKLSKELYGTSHIVSLAEAKHLYDDGAERLIVGAGQEGNVELSEEAVGYFDKKDCKVSLYPTPKAIEKWNEAKGKVIGMFHVTC